MHYVPGKDRSRAYHLEVVFRLRANSVTKLTLSFERTFLKWTEYPPDANHGFYINSAVVSTVLPTAFGYTSVPQNVSTLKQRFVTIKHLNLLHLTLCRGAVVVVIVGFVCLMVFNAIFNNILVIS